MTDALLIGNGVNRLTDDSYSWESIITELARFADKSEAAAEHLNQKPFTLVFEEVFLRSARAKGIKEFELKKRVASVINEIPHNEYHRGFMGSGVRHILTTNYDYNLENSMDAQDVDSSPSRETRYSVFRRRSVNGVDVWHIHGESDHPNTLMLGHDHFSGALQKMRTYLTTGSKRQSTYQSPFRAGKTDFDMSADGVYSWVDVFLRDDVHIIGLSLDYTEIGLWWLIIYKERLRLQDESTGRTLFYELGPRATSTSPGKKALLRSFGVDVVEEYGATSYKEGYSKLIARFG